MNIVSLGEVIKKGLADYALQLTAVLLAFALSFCLFKNGQLNWQLEQTNKQLKSRTIELIAAESENQTLSGAIQSQNNHVNNLAATSAQMRKAGEQATAQAAQREKLLQADIDHLRAGNGRECNANSLSAHITQELNEQEIQPP